MIYEVKAHFFLSFESTARGLYNHMKGIFPQAITINRDTPHAEISSIELIENHHDENPTIACLLLAGLQTKPAK
jgi:hypothetical protein